MKTTLRALDNARYQAEQAGDWRRVDEIDEQIAHARLRSAPNSDRLPYGTRVRILRHRYSGWIARIAHYDASTRFYSVRLLMDQDGKELLNIQHSGPFCRGELEPLTDPQQGDSRPSMDARDGVFSSGMRP